MNVSYKPLWRLLVEREMSKMDLLHVSGISTCTLSKLSKNQPIKLDTIMKICTALECQLYDVVEFQKINSDNDN